MEKSATKGSTSRRGATFVPQYVRNQEQLMGRGVRRIDADESIESLARGTNLLAPQGVNRKIELVGNQSLLSVKKIE